jgi:UDP-N-acetylglucosamine 2-epimerase (non-hydrolysing)
MAPVVQSLQRSTLLEGQVCVTAQHRGMLDDALQTFGITPEEDLDIMRQGQDLTDVTVRVLEGLRGVLARRRPAAVLVHGDTTTCLAAALAAFYAQVPVGHVEAGLRTGDLRAPFPEEANRQLADRLCRWHFVPTAGAAEALAREGLPPQGVEVTGNTVIDALLWMRARVAGAPLATFAEAFGPALPALAGDGPVLLITGHRRESFGDGFQRICRALATLARARPDLTLVYPVHLNPNVQRPVREHLADLPNVHLLPPLSYSPFVRLMDRSTVILTDSGGIQEEAPSLGKPVLVMRETTERPEGLAAGTVELVGTDPDRIVARVTRHLRGEAPPVPANPYGDGRAAERIVARLERDLTLQPSGDS